MTTPQLERLALLSKAARMDGDLLMVQSLTRDLLELKRRRGISRSCRKAWQDMRKRTNIMEGRNAWLRSRSVIDDDNARDRAVLEDLG